MTQAQEDAKKKAINILGEHFTSFVIVTEYQEDDEDDKQEYNLYGSGAYATCLGLLYIGIDTILTKD